MQVVDRIVVLGLARKVRIVLNILNLALGVLA